MFDLEQKKGGKENNFDGLIQKALSASADHIESSIKESSTNELSADGIERLFTNCIQAANTMHEQYNAGEFHDFWDPAGYDYNTNHQIKRHANNVGIGLGRISVSRGDSARKTAVRIMSGMLHDSGKWSYESIVCSGEKLSASDYKTMQEHPMEGYFMTHKGIRESVRLGVLSAEEATEIETDVLNHQQRYDGSGYPMKTKGENIPFSSLEMGVVDSIDAMSTFRGHNMPKTMDQVLSDLNRNVMVQFSPLAVANVLESYPKDKSTGIRDVVSNSTETGITAAEVNLMIYSLAASIAKRRGVPAHIH